MTLESASPDAAAYPPALEADEQTSGAHARNRLVGTLLAVFAGGLGGLAYLGDARHWGVVPLAAGLFVVQTVLALAWPAALDTRGQTGSFLIGVGASAVSDSLLAAQRSQGLRLVAAVGGLSLLAGLFQQLLRRPRPAVIGSLAATLSLVVLELATASPLALRSVVARPGDAIAAGMFGLAAAALAGRFGDLVVRRPALAPHSSRGTLGTALAIAAAAVAGAAWGNDRLPLRGQTIGLRVAVVAAVIGIVADLALDVAADAADLDERAGTAMIPLTVVLPIALAGPAIYVAARYLLG